MDNIISSLNRIEGQVRGIRAMYEKGRNCEEIAQQIAAVRSALRRVGKKLLTDEMVRCSQDRVARDQFEKVIESLVKIS